MKLKAGYKQTQVGVIPEEWKVKSLSELASLYQPETIAATKFTETGYPVYGANGVVGFYHSANHQAWQVTVTCRGSTCGTVNRTVDTCWITGNAMVLNCDNNKNLNKDFFYFLLLGQNMSGCITGTGQPQIVRSPLAAFRVPLPPTLSEQRAIAEALSDVDGLLGGLDRLIAKKRNLKQAAMQQLLTGQTRLPGFHGDWEVKEIGEFTDSTAGGTPSTRVPSYWGGTIRWMSSGELNLKRVEEVEGRITEAGLRNSSTKIIPKRCVLIGLAGQGKTRGTVAINFVELCTNQSIAAVFPNPAFVPEYLYFNLDSRYDELRDLSAGDGGRGGLNLKILKAISIPFPSVPEQTAIASVLTDMDTELAALEQRREKTCALKRGMMQELLIGKTRLL